MLQFVTGTSQVSIPRRHDAPAFPDVTMLQFVTGKGAPIRRRNLTG